MMLKTPLHPGGVALLGLTGDPARAGAGGGEAGGRSRSRSQATSRASSGATSSPAAASPGKVEKGELGLPGVTVQLRDAQQPGGQDGGVGRRRQRSTSG